MTNDLTFWLMVGKAFGQILIIGLIGGALIGGVFLLARWLI